jgi:glycine hydroxymethyltransferase
MVLCTNEYKEVVNKGCPIVLGGPLPHVLAAKAIAFKEAAEPSFSKYAHQIVDNCRALADGLVKLGVDVLTGGSDNHLLVMNVAKSFHLTGRQAETILREAKLTVNRNAIPRDIHGAWYTSGIRMGTPATTTLGMKQAQMKEIASIIFDLLKEAKTDANSKAKAQVPSQVMHRAQSRVADVLKEFPLYPELMID